MKVLIAEDDDHTRQGLADVLSAEGYEVVTAPDGEVALEVFEREAPDLALLDIMMPQRDGYSVCRELLRRRPELPIIFLSARSEEIDQVLGLELGADDYISKPFGVREVIARIRAVTRRALAARRPPPGEEGFRMGDLQVCPRELRARRGDAVVDLSLREVRILELLHRERGRVVDRQRLYDECWGMAYLPNSRTIDQHISKLRKRVEVDPRAPQLIRTVHGAGYRYEG